MEIRFQNSPAEVSMMDTGELRTNFLAEDLMQDNTIQFLYSHYDRVIIKGAKTLDKALKLENDPELRSDYLLQRREMGVINVGGAGSVSVRVERYELSNLDALY